MPLKKVVAGDGLSLEPCCVPLGAFYGAVVRSLAVSDDRVNKLAALMFRVLLRDV